MRSVVPDCLILHYHKLTETLEGLPDPEDRHVLAAAIRGKADAIVTYNLRDFPAEALAEYDLDLLHPDDFLVQQFGLDAAAVLNAARACRSRLRKPQFSPEEYLERLAKLGLPQFVIELRPYSKLI